MHAARPVAESYGPYSRKEKHSLHAHSNSHRQSHRHGIRANLMYDACQMGGIMAAVGCSSYSCTIDGMPTLVRNMDWVWPRSTGKYTRLVRFHRGQESYTSASVRDSSLRCLRRRISVEDVTLTKDPRVGLPPQFGEEFVP